MWRFGKKPGALPRSFFEKGAALLDEAKRESDPEIRNLQLEAARNYYEADMNQPQREPFLRTLLTVLLVYLLIFGIAVYTFRNFSILTAFAICIASFVIFALLLGTALLPAGFIKESTWLQVFKIGVQALLLQRKGEKEGK